jgi:hypothetical protein
MKSRPNVKTAVNGGESENINPFSGSGALVPGLSAKQPKRGRGIDDSYARILIYKTSWSS